MASTRWNLGADGNWSASGNWSSGAPNTGTDVTINAFGNYTVSVTSFAGASSLTVNAAGALINESAAGSFDIVNALTLQQGKIALRAANTIGSVNQSGGVLETGNNTALGGGAYTFSGGELLGIANETYANQMAMSGNITFAAAHGTVLTEDASSWAFDATNGGSIRFGQGANDGSIVWDTVSGSLTNPGHVAVEIASTVVGGDNEWGFLFENASQTLIDAGSTLDANGFNGDVSNLAGTGRIINSGAAAATLTTLGGGNFGGTISGALALEVSGGALVLTGANTYTGGTTVDSGCTLQLGNGGTAGSVVGDFTDNGTLIYDHSSSFTQTAGIAGTGDVTYEGGGNVTVNRAEGNAGNTSVIGETLSANNGGALGNGIATLAGAEFIATGTETLTATRLNVTGSSAVAAAHGKTLTGAASWALDGASAPTTLNINDASHDGIVVWLTGAGSTVINLGACSVEVHAGTFKAGDDSFAFLTENAQAGVTVDSGATLDMSSFGGAIVDLSGAGAVKASGAANIEIIGGQFGGVISGVASLLVEDGLVLSGTNTYTKGTTIDTGSALQLGVGGTVGSVVGNIVDNGFLIYDHSDNINLGITVSGSGALEQVGPGILTVDRTETYSGGTFVTNGELSIDRAAALGSGSVTLNGGEFLTTSTLSVVGRLLMSGNVTIAAATGTQVNFNSSTGWNLDAIAPTSITFGDGTNNGTVLFHTPAGSGISNTFHYAVDIHSGVLKAGDFSLGFLLDDTSATTIDSGASLNANGFSIDVANLAGAGQITNTGASQTFAIETGTFAGQVNGALSQVQIFGMVGLSGTGNFAGEFKIEGSSELDISGVWTQNTEFGGAGAFFLKTPGQYSGHVVGFQSGDIIEVRGVDFNDAAFSESYNATTGVLTLADSHHTYHVTFDGGGYALGNFAASSDTHAGTDITYQAVAELPPHPVLASDYPDATVF